MGWREQLLLLYLVEQTEKHCIESTRHPMQILWNDQIMIFKMITGFSHTHTTKKHNKENYCKLLPVHCAYCLGKQKWRCRSACWHNNQRQLIKKPSLQSQLVPRQRQGFSYPPLGETTLAVLRSLPLHHKPEQGNLTQVRYSTGSQAFSGTPIYTIIYILKTFPIPTAAPTILLIFKIYKVMQGN